MTMSAEGSGTRNQGGVCNCQDIFYVTSHVCACHNALRHELLRTAQTKIVGGAACTQAWALCVTGMLVAQHTHDALPIDSMAAAKGLLLDRLHAT